MMKRYIEDGDCLKCQRIILEEKPGSILYSEKIREKARKILAEADAGKPPMIDALTKVDLWVLQRMTELSEGQFGRPGFYSDVTIVLENQRLWGIEDEKELKRAMIEIIEALPE